MSTSGASTGRRDHTAVWIGDRMIVWGGTNGSFGSLGSGGGYCACLETTWHLDSDGDGFGDPAVMTVACAPPPGYVPDGTDCDDADPALWRTPGEARSLVFLDQTTLAWQPPGQPGSATLVYDLLRSDLPSDFSASDCVATDAPGTTAHDPAIPEASPLFGYLVRAQNGCPGGEGSLGTRSDGTPRSGAACP